MTLRRSSDDLKLKLGLLKAWAIRLLRLRWCACQNFSSCMICLCGCRSIACRCDGTREALSPSLSSCSFGRCFFQKAEKSCPFKSNWCPFRSLRHPCHICCSAYQVELWYVSARWSLPVYRSLTCQYEPCRLNLGSTKVRSTMDDFSPLTSIRPATPL